MVLFNGFISGSLLARYEDIPSYAVPIVTVSIRSKVGKVKKTPAGDELCFSSSLTQDGLRLCDEWVFFCLFSCQIVGNTDIVYGKIAFKDEGTSIRVEVPASLIQTMNEENYNIHQVLMKHMVSFAWVDEVRQSLDDLDIIHLLDIFERIDRERVLPGLNFSSGLEVRSTCQGCISNAGGQGAHFGYGGCLEQ